MTKAAERFDEISTTLSLTVEGGFGVSRVAALANFSPRVLGLRLNRVGFRI